MSQIRQLYNDIMQGLKDGCYDPIKREELAGDRAGVMGRKQTKETNQDAKTDHNQHNGEVLRPVQRKAG